jgi:hypothetical protein
MRKIWSLLPLWGMALCFIPGCIIVGARDEFRRYSNESVGPFVPDFYIEKSQSHIYLPLLRVDLDRLPHDVVLLLYDQTYTNTSRHFDKVVLESVIVEYADGETVELLSPDKPEAERTFSVPKGKDVFGKDAKLTFKAAISRGEAFTLILRGRAIPSSGPDVPFRSAERYRFDGRKWTWWTLTQEWASC